MNFESAREQTYYEKGNNAESLMNDIITLVKAHNLSLSQTRALFHEIVNRIEDTPLCKM